MWLISSITIALALFMANPTAVQWVNGSGHGNFSNGTWTNNGFEFLNFPDVPGGTGVPANNTILVFVQAGTAGLTNASFAVTDDKGNTYTGLTGGSDGTNTQSCVAYRSMKVTGGVRAVKVQNLSGVALEYGQVAMVHCNDLDTFDTSSANNGTSTAATAGSLTPAQTGDFIIQYVARTGVAPTTSFAPATQSNISWQLLTGDLITGDSMQCGVYNSTSAINPQIDMGDSTAFISVALAFKTGTFGSPRASGMSIAAVHHLNSRNPFTEPAVTMFPAVGNLAVIGKIGFVAHGDMTTVTDASTNAWTVRSATSNDSSVQYAYAQNYVGGNSNKLTINHTDALSDNTWMIYDIVGAAASPFELEATATGNQTVSGNLTSISGFTPTAPGIVICIAGIAFDTLNGLTGAGQVFDSIFYDGQNASGPSSCDQNNGWAHIYNSDLSSITFTWTKVGALAIGQWASSAIAFASASAGVGADFGNRPHPGRSPGFGGISSARFQTNWWPYSPPVVVTFDPALMAAMDRPRPDIVITAPRVVASGMTPPDSLPS